MFWYIVDFQVCFLHLCVYLCVFLIFLGQGSQSCLGDYNGDITSAPTMTTQTTDESRSSHTASIRCEATFESSKLCSISIV